VKAWRLEGLKFPNATGQSVPAPSEQMLISITFLQSLRSAKGTSQQRWPSGGTRDNTTIRSSSTPLANSDGPCSHHFFFLPHTHACRGHNFEC
jgi:hypothetical protein